MRQVDADTDSAAIRADIEATRARMGEALDELGSRLNPDRLKQEAKDTVREATIGRVQTMARNTVDRATVAGRTAASVVRENPIPMAMIAAGLGWLALRGRAHVTVPATVTEKASEISHVTADRTKAVAADAKDAASSAYDSSPLAVGAIVLATGLAVGMSIPSTRREGELFGSARDDLVDRAREIAIEKKEQIQQIAERVVDEV